MIQRALRGKGKVDRTQDALEIDHVRLLKTTLQFFCSFWVGPGAGIPPSPPIGAQPLADDLQYRSIMAYRRTNDREPGPQPLVHNSGDSTTFEFDAVSPETGERLVIRCDSKGQIWVSINPPVPRS